MKKRLATRSVSFLLSGLSLSALACHPRETDPGPPPPVAVSAVSVDPPLRALVVNATAQLVARPRDAAGRELTGRAVAWTTSDSAVATVTGGGLVTGRATGAAVVAATCEGARGSSQITVTNPVPSASQVRPAAVWQGSASLQVEVAGTDFQPGSVVRWNGAARTTTYVAESLLRAVVSTEDLAAAGDIAITVWTPEPGGGESGRLTLSVLPHPAGRIVFTRGSDIWTMNADGSAQTNLTRSPGVREANPAWSPDGSRIVFDSDPGGDRELFVMYADGSGTTRLTARSGSDSAGTWSPDGARIAYLCGDGAMQHVCVVRPDGSGLADLTEGGGPETGPMWSPDGSRLAFSSYRDGNWEIYVMAADGTGPANISQHGAYDFFPQWAPDGSQILFYSNRTGNWDVFVATPQGRAPTNLTLHPGDDHASLWSPTGASIAFMSERTGRAQIYVMSATGGEQRNVSGSAGESFMASWSPDGEWVAFTTDRDANREIYVVRSTGGPTMRLTEDLASDELGWRGLAWSGTSAARPASRPRR